MTLREKQSAFAKAVPRLIDRIYRAGYEVTFSESWRREGVGKEWSLHRKRLAIDLNLFLAGKYLTSTNAHQVFGHYWEKLGKRLDLPLRWGGRFGDGNHYSFEHGGVK